MMLWFLKIHTSRQVAITHTTTVRSSVVGSMPPRLPRVSSVKTVPFEVVDVDGAVLISGVLEAKATWTAHETVEGVAWAVAADVQVDPSDYELVCRVGPL